MKLRNKKTGGVDDFRIEASGLEWMGYASLKEFCEAWEDYEEPKELWFIAHDGSICSSRSDLFTKEWQKLGLTFETKEEAEKAVKKLKAWQRLKELGTEVLGWEIAGLPTPLDKWQTVNIRLNVRVDKKEPMELLDLLVGGEE